MIVQCTNRFPIRLPYLLLIICIRPFISTFYTIVHITIFSLWFLCLPFLLEERFINKINIHEVDKSITDCWAKGA